MSDAAENIVARGKTLRLILGTKWHLAHPQYMMLFHNVRNGEGVIASISAAAQVPGQEDMVNPQIIKAQNDPKEQAWERVRKEMDSGLPTRNGAFFVVADEAAAEAINHRWFRGDNRHLLATRVIAGSSIFEADASWLDGSATEWEQNARNYWSGKMSANPMREQLIHGAVYFPEWKCPPFGLFGMPSTK
jgi:hypothetical protein